nr:MAG TPA: hypothetical protein [Bacteriophage sp.]
MVVVLDVRACQSAWLLDFAVEPWRWGIVRLSPTDGTSLGRSIKFILSVSAIFRKKRRESEV